ncbi:uncharacterized protein LOC144436250 [Glandiceps talaboti]
MPPTVHQIKEQLLKAIDKDANVVDMAGVVEVISVLERFAVTKEALEETRLGKLVNDIRKNTKNEDLSKRCRKLLKLWQKLCIPQPPNANRLPRSGSGTSLNGSNTAPSSTKTSQLEGNKIPDVRPSTSQTLGKTNIANRKKRRAEELGADSPGSRPPEKKKFSAATDLVSDSDLVNGLPNDAKTVTSAVSAKRIKTKANTPTGSLSSSSHLSPKRTSSPRPHVKFKASTPTLRRTESSSKFHKSDSAPDLKSKAYTSSSSKREQFSGSSHSSSSTSGSKDIKQSGSESSSHKSATETSLEPRSESKDDSIHIHSELSSEQNKEAESTSQSSDILSKCDDTTEEVAKEPSSPPLPPPPRKEITEDDVKKLHNENWEGVNGCYDNQGEWQDWSNSLVVNTNEDNVLHILPYVILD